MIPKDAIIDLMCAEAIEKYKRDNKMDYALRNWDILFEIVTDIRKQKEQYKFKTIHFDCHNFIYYYMLLNDLDAIMHLCKLDSITVRVKD